MTEAKQGKRHRWQDKWHGMTRGARLRVLLLAVALVAGLAGGWYWVTAGLPPVPPTRSVQADERQVNLLAMGDWGDDTWAEIDVANAMAAYVESRASGIDAVLLAGDNFYEDLTGVDDPRWRLFEELFDSERLAMPFYAALGNHDYRDSAAIELEYARLNPQSRWKLPARWYRIDLPADEPLVTVFMLDSNSKHLGDETFEAQRQWLEAELRKPRTARWTIVCAHHPLFSNGRSGDSQSLQQQWGELFQEHDVDFYIAGHDHDMQHLNIADHDTSFIICGSGGAHTRALIRNDRGPFGYAMNGFVHLRLGERSADIRFLDKAGQVVYAFDQEPRGAAAPVAGER